MINNSSLLLDAGKESNGDADKERGGILGEQAAPVHKDIRQKSRH